MGKNTVIRMICNSNDHSNFALCSRVKTLLDGIVLLVQLVVDLQRSVGYSLVSGCSSEKKCGRWDSVSYHLKIDKCIVGLLACFEFFSSSHSMQYLIHALHQVHVWYLRLYRILWTSIGPLFNHSSPSE